MTKLEYGACLAASLAYLMNRQRDAVGLTAFDDRIVSMLPASARPGHLRAVLLTLDRLTLGQQTNVSKPLHQLADSLSKRGMVVLISDLLDDPEQVIRGLEALPVPRHRRHRLPGARSSTRSSFRSSARPDSRISRPARK